MYVKIDFNGISIHIVLFYVYKVGNYIHCVYIYIF